MIDGFEGYEGLDEIATLLGEEPVEFMDEVGKKMMAMSSTGKWYDFPKLVNALIKLTLPAIRGMAEAAAESVIVEKDDE